MTTQATWNALSGSWFTAANWDEPNSLPPPAPPIVHYVPGADNDVSIPNNSGLNPPTPFTVTYNGTSTINKLAGDVTGTLDITGGSLTLLHGGQYNSMTVNVAGGATLSVSADTLITTAGNYTGTVSGNGRITFVGGDFAINAGANFSIAQWVLGVTANGLGAKTTLNTDLTYANDFTLADYSGNASILKLNTHTLTLSGTSLLDGQVQGAGTLRITGAAQSGTGYGQLSAINGATVNIGSGGSLTQHHNVLLGNAGTTGTLSIDAGGSYRIDGSVQLGGFTVANSQITNNGTLISDGAGINAVIVGQMTSTGSLQVTTGNRLVFGGGGTYALGGSLSGAGKMVIGNGITTLNSANVSVASLGIDGGNPGATLKLGNSLTYAGVLSFDFLFDTLQLNGKTLTLSGQSNVLNGNQVNGAGTLKITGTTSIGSNIAFGSAYGGGTSMTLQNAAGGKLNQTGGVSLNGTLQNDYGAVYTIAAASTLSSSGASGATTVNNGTFTVTGAGNSFVQGGFKNYNILTVGAGAQLILNNGTQSLGGTVSGAGSLVFGGAANATLNTTNLTVGAIALAGGNQGARLTLGRDLTYAGAFSFANSFDHLELNGKTLRLTGANTSLQGNNVNGTGKLVISGTATIGGNLGLGYGNGPGNAMTLQNSGTINQTGSLSLNGTLINDAGRTYTITSLGNIYSSGAGANIINNGTFFDKSPGVMTVGGAFTNAGKLLIGTNSTLVMDQGVKTLGGEITGNGRLQIGFAGNATLNTTNVTVASIALGGGNSSAKLTLGNDLAYAGALVFVSAFDELRLNGHTLTLSGTANSLIGSSVNGPGTLKITGAAKVGGNVSFGNGASASPMTLENAGSVTQVSDISLNGTLLNGAGKTYAITAPSNIYSNGSGGTITNNGIVSVTGAGTTEFFTALATSGTLSVGAGATLSLRGVNTLAGTVSGAGGVILRNNTAINTTAVTTARLAVSGGTTTLGVDLAYAGAFTFDNGFATVFLDGHRLALTGATSLTGGVLRGANGKLDRVSITGSSVNMSALGFSDWEATDTITITGTSGADTLVGSSQRDTINGGDGADTLRGGAGADALIGGIGNDTASYAGSSAAVNVNLLTGVATGGDAAGDTFSGMDSLIGSDLADTLTGNAGANKIDGGGASDVIEGGAGGDTLIGGTGNDTASYAGSAAAVSVNLLTGAASGGDAAGDTFSGMDSLFGSTKNDTFIGNNGSNRLDGALGSDMLTGNGGVDTFVFDTALGATNIDTITDLTVGSDLVELSKSIFSALQNGATPGSLAASSFRLASQASTSGGLGEIIYDATTGSLSYDADGSGAGAAQQFAQVSSALALSASSFRLV